MDQGDDPEILFVVRKGSNTPPQSPRKLPPIVGVEVEVQTEISLVSDASISSFRPQHLTEEISPYPPLPVISTLSAPALLREQQEHKDHEGENEAHPSDLAGSKTDSLSIQESGHSHVTSDESRSEWHDADSQDSYSAVSELEGVGPPTILQYIKESSRVRKSVPAPKPLSERFPSVDPTTERGNMCPFCHTELLPVPPLSDASDDEDSTENQKPQQPESIATPSYGIKDVIDKDDYAMSNFSVESPPPILSKEDERTCGDDEKLPCDGYMYCCEDYYWHLINKGTMERRDSFYQEGEVMEIKKIDVSPHAPFGSKTARKMAKDRASERVRERELEKVRPLGGPPRAGGATLFGYSRQMKTINFALSSKKCLEDGWTVTNYKPPPKSPEPVLFETVTETQCHPLPGLNVPWQQQFDHKFHRYYDSGGVFLTMLHDGTGTCYYPSGSPAIVISQEQPGMFCYYVLSEKGRLVGVCSHSGRSTIYHEDGKLQYQSTPLEGTVFNKEELKTKHWRWDAFQPHVHAPPFQSVYFTISPFLSMRSVSLEQQTLVFSYKRHSFKCNVGSRTSKLMARPLECPELRAYLGELETAKHAINENLRKLNNSLHSAHQLAFKEAKATKRRASDSTRSVTVKV